ncbi:MAG: hypothetical protein KTR35_05795, partial [Gammaproteobacteria bacterium]|nr:hypothetical protein [Gammaproteobacteria bacterium]
MIVMNRADKNIDTFEWQDALQKNAVLLTVNQRLARHYHSMYQDWRMSQGAVSWETPQILPLDAWLAQLHQLAVAQSLSKKVLLHDLAARQLWRQCIEWDLTHYRGNDALVSLLNVDAAAAEAGKAWSIEHQWQVNVPNDTPLSKDQCAYARWRKRYQRRCLEEGWIDSSMLGLHVVELLRAPSGLDIPQHVLTAGFLSINPLQQMLLEQLTKNGIQCDDIPLLGREPQNCCQSIYDGGAEELASVAARCRRLLEASPTCRMGVVVPALAMRRQALVRAFDAEFFPGLNPEQIMAIGRPYDVSLGVPLLELPPIRAAITSLQFLIAGLDSSAVSQWLVSPYLIDATGQAVARRRLDQALRRESLQRYTLTTWHPAKGDSALVRAIAAVGKLQVRSSKTLSDYADFFSKVLEALGWPGHSLGSEEFQAVQVWQSVLDDMQHVDDGSALSAPQAFVELQRLCRDRVFQPESARVPIQVMGRLESHGLSFDALMLVGMDSAHWPPSTSANTFLPFSIQKEAGVPESSKEHQLALARAELSFWQSAAKQVWFTSARLREGQECSTTDLLSAVALERCDE